MSVNSSVEIHDLDEDTDSVAEDEDQDTASGLGDEHEETNSTSIERAIIIPPSTSIERAIIIPPSTKVPIEKDDDDFRPVKKRKVQENNEGTEVDEVVKMSLIKELLHVNI